VRLDIQTLRLILLRDDPASPPHRPSWLGCCPSSCTRACSSSSI